MTLTLTLKKNFYIHFFIVSNRRHIACYIYTSVLLYIVAKMIKSASKYVKFPFFTFWKLSESAYFRSHVLLLCVIYLMFSYFLMVTRCHFEILRLILLFWGHTCFTLKE